MSTLSDQLPWTSLPVIVNAPMAGFAGGKLAATVTLTGGLGLIGGPFDMDDVRKELQVAVDILSSDSRFSCSHSLPIGIGFLPFLQKLEDVVVVIKEFKPAVIWLFAAKSLDDYAQWALALRKVSPDTRIWIQTGSVAAALHIAKTAQPDVLCMQGADAGGHGFEKGAGIISLLPEAFDTLAREGFSHIPLVASGGIVDGRGVAAALILGAQGVVMGTRFLASREVIIHPNYQAAVLEARDGGQVTTRSKLFDQLRGPNIWPEAYDGRSLAVRSYKDYVEGVGLDEIQKSYSEAVGHENKGFQTGLQGRAAIWAGTGVGQVNDMEGAGDIVRRVRTEAKDVLKRSAEM